MMPEIPVDFPEYDYSGYMLFGGEAAGTFKVESPFGNNPCEICILAICTDAASTFILQEGSVITTDKRGNGARMFYCEFGGAGTVTPTEVWIPTGGRMTLTTDGVHEYMTAVFRRKTKIRHHNPPLPSTHHYTPNEVHVAHEEDVNARKC